MSKEAAESVDYADNDVSLKAIKKIVDRMTNTLSMIGLLEFKSVSLSFAAILAVAIFIAFLAFSVWLALMSALALCLLQHQISLYFVIMILAILQIVLAIPLIFWLCYLAKKLLFPKTREALAILNNH